VRAIAIAIVLAAAPAGAKPRCRPPKDAVVDRARTHAYAARDREIVEIDLATCGERRIYTTPDDPPDFCARMTKGVPLHPLTDRPVALADGGTTLVLERYGAGCHVPDHERVRVTDFADPARAHAHPERHIYALAAGAGAVYMIDGDGVWRSADAGDTWTALSFGDEPDGGDRGVGLAADTIAIDRDRIVVATLEMPEIGGQFSPGPILRSDDGGATWTRAPAHTRRPRRTRSLTLGHDRFDATDDGVIRTRAGAKQRVTPDPARAPSRDLFELYVKHPT
jgi:hypothetical protein